MHRGGNSGSKNTQALRRSALRAMCKATLVRVVTETGPRKRTVLDGLANGDATVLDELLAEGVLVTIGSKRGTQYGTPEQRRSAERSQ